MARRKTQAMRYGNVSDAVSHSNQALVTAAAAATAPPPIRRLSQPNSGKCISGETSRGEKKKRKEEAEARTCLIFTRNLLFHHRRGKEQL